MRPHDLVEELGRFVGRETQIRLVQLDQLPPGRAGAVWAGRVGAGGKHEVHLGLCPSTAVHQPRGCTVIHRGGGMRGGSGRMSVYPIHPQLGTGQDAGTP